MSMHRILVPLLLVGIVVAAATVGLAMRSVTTTGPAPAIVTERVDADTVATLAATIGSVEVHRSESCGCCAGHVDHLVDAGFEVTEEVHADEAAVPALKERHGIPQELWSCHTTLVDGYAVEGHVPAEVIATLLVERPDVEGVALAGMPAGSPGMPGDQVEPWVFETFRGGVVDGVLTTWEIAEPAA
jgi:hypothetical protein